MYAACAVDEFLPAILESAENKLHFWIIAIKVILAVRSILTCQDFNFLILDIYSMMVILFLVCKVSLSHI